ncbi:MAG: cation transporter [Salibacteraceae bacterium]|nr:cation transporter [Salibacteraceae bacterium]
MKKIILSSIFTAFFGSLSFISYSQSVVEDTITVEGICGMCQKRIEEAAYGKGVKFVSWDKATKKMAVAYKDDKTSLQEIEERIATAGHKTEHVDAKRDDYDSLPDCCKYETLHTH